MNIPDGLLELGIGGVVGFSVKVLFGLIRKNEIKSDEADARIHQEIKDVRQEMKEIEERYRNNDRDLYQADGDLKVMVAELKAELNAIKGLKERRGN